jgi:hypothetical protein
MFGEDTQGYTSKALICLRDVAPRLRIRERTAKAPKYSAGAEYIYGHRAPKCVCAFLLPNETKSAEVLPAVPPGNYH